MKLAVKVFLPIAVLVFSGVIFFAINVLGKQHIDPVDVDTRPLVTIQSAEPRRHQVLLTEYASVEPVERTPIAAQVAGEVVSWNPNLLEGGRVNRGELLFSIEKDAYEAAYLQAEANLNQAQSELIEQKAQAQVAANEASRTPGRQYTDLFLRKPQVMSAEASVKSAEAALKIASRDLSNCDVFAPYDALVVSSDIGLGQFLNAGTSVATLYNIESAKIQLPIPGFDSRFLPADMDGMAVRISDQGPSGKTHSGYISHDIGVIDEATRMTHLLVRIDNPYDSENGVAPLKFGSYVKVSFPGRSFDNVIRIPADLVNNHKVWIVNGESKLESRKVEVLREEGTSFLIQSGLSEDDKIVTTLPEYPQDGMAVRVAESSPKEGRALNAGLSSGE